MTKNDLVELVMRTATTNGGTPLGDAAFFRQTGLTRSALWDVGIRTYGDLCELAGYERGTMHQHPAADAILEPLAQLTLRLGHFPNSTDREVERRADPSFPSRKVLTTATKKRGPLPDQLLEWCASKPEYADAARILQRHSTAPTERTPRKQRVVRGHVYLFRYGKAGRDYKIGKTENVSRRHAQLQTMIPGSLRIVHVIDTDDPDGIEEYWLRRFLDRRLPKKQEIFRLAADDVAAFKARRYQ